MKVVFAQLNYTIGDFDGNSEKIIQTLHDSKQEGADLVLFSELSVTGYYPHDLLEKKEGMKFFRPMMKLMSPF